MMRTDADPWEIAEVYNGRQHLLDHATLDFLLDDLEKRLEVVLALPDWGNSEPLYRPLALLAHVNTLGLLEQLASRQGTQVESLLAQFLLRIGPQRGSWRNSVVRDEALAALYRMAGSELTTVVNSYLTADDRYALLDGIDLVAKRPNDETIRLLTALSESNETWDGHFAIQCKAAEVLADVNEWLPVLALIERIGLATLTEVTDYARHDRRPPPELAAGVTDRVRTNIANSSPGALLIVGMGGRESDGPLLREVLSACQPESKQAHACVIALELLPDKSEESVPLLEAQLPLHEFSAINALIVNGTRSALQALREHQQNTKLNVAITISLLNRLPVGTELISEIVQLLESQVRSNGYWDVNQNLSIIVDHIARRDTIDSILASSLIREHLRTAAFADEGSSWFTGSKAAAIRCLSRFDKHAAYLAARTALQNVDWHDRELYPYLLVEYGKMQAIPILYDQLTRESESKVSRAICRSLALIEHTDHVLQRLDSTDPTERRTACIAAGWARAKSNDLRDKLQALVGDKVEDVADTAAKTSQGLALQAESLMLLDSLMKENDAAKRWLMLDCLLATADLGDEHRPWPTEDNPLRDVLTPLQINYVIDRLKSLREEEQRRSRV